MQASEWLSSWIALDKLTSIVKYALFPWLAVSHVPLILQITLLPQKTNLIWELLTKILFTWLNQLLNWINQTFKNRMLEVWPL